MPAASVAVLRDFETQFDDLLADLLAVFEAAPYSLQLADHTATAELTVPRLEYEFALAEPPGPAGANLTRPATGAQIAYAGQISFRLVYDHTKTTAAEAAAFRGALRTLLSPETAAIGSANLPHLEIAALTETAAARGRFTNEKEKLLSEWYSQWAVVWYIREEAWPI
ncbi:MAG TPA: hypothetical protein VLH79_06860 [Chthonomonadales bacterium]|nr:hypothetical protein [Chthonomonadales bacterium]